MSATTVYSYYNSSGIRTYIDDPELNKLGAWSSSGTYFGPPPYSAVTFGNSLYLAVEDSIGQSPAIVTMPPRFWSPLVIVSEGTVPNEADLALELAGSAIVLAGSAYVLAGTAFAVAGSAYTLAGSALGVANDAITIANGAFDIATSGSNLALLAYTIAQEGTNTGTAALDLATTGSNLAWAAWVAAGTHPTTLAGLTDVLIPSPTAGEVLTFDGSNWQAASQSPTVVTAAFTLYLSGTDVTNPGYDSLRVIPSSLPETTIGVTTSGAPVFIDQFISGTIGRSVLDGGEWAFNTFATGSKGKCFIRTDTFIQTFGTVETPLFSVISPALPTSPLAVTATAFGTIQGIDPSARLIARYYGFQTGGGSATITLYHSGVTNFSNIETPLSAYHNNLAGLQGGKYVPGDFSQDEMYHLTAAQSSVVVSLATGTVVGNLDVTGNVTTTNVQVGVGTVPAVTGTTHYDFNGPAYQLTTVDRNIIVSGTNFSPGREIAVILVATGGTFNLGYDPFTFYGTTPPPSISNKNVLLALTSTTSATSGVIGASSVAQ